MTYSFNKKVLFYYDDIIGTFQYTPGHPMKPFRLPMTQELVKAYNLNHKMDYLDSNFADAYIKYEYDQMLTKFHSEDYIDLIKNVTPENKFLYEDQLYRFNFGEDCPVIDRLYEYVCTYTTATLVSSSLLYHNNLDVAINYAGGLHHAKQSEASGFCYVNDIVISILEMLKHYQRILYVDIDIHHGDGVEEAFYTTDRVLTCSFHKFRDYFPGTGHIDDIGTDKGVYHAVNFPLNQGVDDESFTTIFKAVIKEIMEKFRPSAIIMQCGGDSLSGDRLGCFNLSIRGHGECVKFVKSFNVPLILVGGGGYTLRNVPRCWVYETGIILNEDIANEMPQNEYIEYFAPEYKLHLPVSNMENLNTKEYLESIIIKILENLKHLNAGGVQISHYADKDVIDIDPNEVMKIANDKKMDEMNE